MLHDLRTEHRSTGNRPVPNQRLGGASRGRTGRRGCRKTVGPTRSLSHGHRALRREPDRRGTARSAHPSTGLTQRRVGGAGRAPIAGASGGHPVDHQYRTPEREIADLARRTECARASLEAPSDDDNPIPNRRSGRLGARDRHHRVRCHTVLSPVSQRDVPGGHWTGPTAWLLPASTSTVTEPSDVRP